MQANKVESAPVAVEVPEPTSVTPVSEQINLAEYGLEEFAGRTIEFGDKSGSVEYALTICPHFMMLPKAAVGAVIKTTIMEQEKMRAELEPEEDPLEEETATELKDLASKSEEIPTKEKLKADVSIKAGENSETQTPSNRTTEHFDQQPSVTLTEQSLEKPAEIEPSEAAHKTGQKHENEQALAETQAVAEVTKPSANETPKIIEISVTPTAELAADKKIDNEISGVRLEAAPQDIAEEVVVDVSEEAVVLYEKLTEDLPATDSEITQNYDDAEQPTHAQDTLPGSAHSFKVFVNEQEPVTEAFDFESIVVQAEEQTLESTFVQLASYFSEVLPDTDDGLEAPAISEREIAVREILATIEELISTQPNTVNEKETTLKLTPEITQKLLDLLRALGYQNPQEVLAYFVSKHGIEFLIQAMQYMCQLMYKENRYEFYGQPGAIAVNDDDTETVQARLGRAIMAFLKPITIATEAALVEESH